jgi:hypothetical protein
VLFLKQIVNHNNKEQSKINGGFMQKPRWFLNVVILLFCASAAIMTVVSYGQNPFTIPIVHMSVSNEECVSVTVIDEGKEVKKSCYVFEELKQERKRYETQYVK